MKSLATYIFIILFCSNGISQNKLNFDAFKISVDSILKKQSKLQKQNRESNTLVFLADSIIDFYFDDFFKPCENQPTKNYYTYNINGNVATKETKNTPEPGCEVDAYYNRYTYSYNGNHPNNVTEYLRESFDFITNEWVNTNKYSYQYDTYNNQIEVLSQQWNENTSSWENTSRLENTYNINLLLSSNRYSWDSDSNDWFWNRSETYQYNTNGNLLQYLYNSWDYTLNEWETLRKKIYEYDAYENVTMYAEYQKYTSENQYEWNRITITNSAYDTSNYLIEEIIYRDWNNNTQNWNTKKKYDYTNNANGSPIETHIYLWNETTNNWDNESRLFTTYNTNSYILEEITQEWESNSWENLNRILFTYNSSNLWIEKLQETWNNEWENNIKETRVYNEFDNLLEYKYEYWYGTNWYVDYYTLLDYDDHQNLIQYIDSGIFHYNEVNIYYSEYDVELGISNLNINNAISIVPNPSNLFISILGLEKEASISIYDVSGKLLLKSANKNQINISSFDQGIYIVKIASSDSVISKKFIKE